MNGPVFLPGCLVMNIPLPLPRGVEKQEVLEEDTPVANDTSLSLLLHVYECTLGRRWAGEHVQQYFLNIQHSTRLISWLICFCVKTVTVGHKHQCRNHCVPCLEFMDP